MRDQPVPLFCPSCTCTHYAEPMDGEHLFATKARIRRAMGDSCSRDGMVTGKRCPMKEHGIVPATPSVRRFRDRMNAPLTHFRAR